MAHNIFEQVCTVYIWRPHGALRGTIGNKWGKAGARVGHAAIQVSTGGLRTDVGNLRAPESVYLSYWPEHAPVAPGNNLEHSREKVNTKIRDQNPTAKQHEISALTGLTMQIGKDPVMDGDVDHEGGKPDVRFRFKFGFKDWDAMVKEARGLKRDAETKKYDILYKNCCTAVAQVLNAGQPIVQVPMKGWIHNVWQPSDIESYCNRLKAECNAKFSGSAKMRNAGTKWGAWG